MRGGAAPLGLRKLVPASAPGSRTLRGGERVAGPKPGVSDPAKSASYGWLKVRGRAAESRAGGRPFLPGTSRSSASGTCRPSLAETRSRGGSGKPARSSPHRGSHPRGRRRRRRRQSRPPLAALERVRGGGRLAGERRRSACVR